MAPLTSRLDQKPASPTIASPGCLQHHSLCQMIPPNHPPTHSNQPPTPTTHTTTPSPIRPWGYSSCQRRPGISQQHPFVTLLSVMNNGALTSAANQTTQKGPGRKSEPSCQRGPTSLSSRAPNTVHHKPFYWGGCIIHSLMCD